MTDEYAERSDLDLAAPTGPEPAPDPGPHSRSAERQAPPRRRLDRGLLLASLLIAGGIVVVVWGMFGAVTGNEGIDRPAAIETLTPVENAIQVLQQEPVIVDLQFGYEATLTIDGIELPTTTIGQIDVAPGEQIEFPPTAIFDPGSSIISFQPVEGAPIESFAAGTHQVRLVYWRVEEGPEAARSYSWSFNAV